MTEEIATVASNREFPPGTWVVDDTTSRVGFEVGNLWGLAKVRGEFELVRGVLAVGPRSVDAHLTIDASSLNLTTSAAISTCDRGTSSTQTGTPRFCSRSRRWRLGRAARQSAAICESASRGSR